MSNFTYNFLKVNCVSCSTLVNSNLIYTTYFCLSHFLITSGKWISSLIYLLNKRLLENMGGKRKEERAKETCSIYCSLCKWPQQLDLSQMKTRSNDSGTWAVIHCLPRCVNKKLNGKKSSNDLNQHPTLACQHYKCRLSLLNHNTRPRFWS